MSLLPIQEIAAKLDLPAEAVMPYGKYKAKIDTAALGNRLSKTQGKLVLVTAITPTKAGEGKTTTSIGLADGMAKIGQKAMLCLREPSLGPVFGIKGGATGGGKASIGPKDDIDLHFTGDFHALTSSINLISAVVENSLYQGNPLRIDPNRIVWKRALDMNDRSLRAITVAENDPKGIPHPSEFVITVASEMMAIYCLAASPEDFLERLKKIIVAYDVDGKALTVADFKVSHAVMRLMRDAFYPNLVQTLEHNPCFVQGGPFANIAHGCNSLIATKTALRLAPIVITEAGFGADLGAEKFLDIKCQVGGLRPDACVMVATIRALKMHGGVAFEDLAEENVEALLRGVPNLERHVENIKKFGLPVVVAINQFPTDTEKELDALFAWCASKGYRCAINSSFLNGGEGAAELAKIVKDMLENEPSNYHPIYDRKEPVYEKIERICKEIYGASGVEYSDKARAQIAEYEALGFGDAFVCMAKTPLSFTDSPKVLGAPKDFQIHVREVNLASGSNFLIPLTGTIFTMPGLPKVPLAQEMEEEPWN
ncbi:MAG: formate--tetrahydrofolate ligase [Bacilli bacterium]|nr:formate--tetrahydrofolate ligase [Bacilli bacterium]